MAGYGNRTQPEYGDHEDHATTRLGLTESGSAYSNAHPTYGSGATGGAGFGNKSDPSPQATQDDNTFRFGSHADTAPYSGATPHGSGSTGGAGWGNKTGSFDSGSAGSHDSTVGKVMQKAGKVLHAPGLAEKGLAKREVAGFEGK